MAMQIIKRKYTDKGKEESNVLEPLDSWGQVQIAFDMLKYEYPLYEGLMDYYLSSQNGKTIYYVKIVH